MNLHHRDFWNAAPSRLACAIAWLAQSAFLAAVYARLNALGVGHSVATPLLPFESRIPLVPAAAPLYASLYAELVLPVFLVRTGRAFVRIQAASALACVCAFAVYVLIPMNYPRPHLEAHDGVSRLLVAIWNADPASNTFPSLHVTCAWLIAFSVGERSRAWRVAGSINAVLISVSTLFVKQHFVVDVATGALLALSAWRIAAGVSARCEDRFGRKSPPSGALSQPTLGRIAAAATGGAALVLFPADAVGERTS
jgi:membrane-associated phospholipid phosphatase